MNVDDLTDTYEPCDRDRRDGAADFEALGRKFQRELNTGLVALVLLSVLERAGQELYGYQIAKQMQGRARSAPGPMRQGAHYPVLRTLATQGLLTSRVVPSYAGPARRYYRITEAGRKTLAAWLVSWRTMRDFVDDVTAPRP